MNECDLSGFFIEFSGSMVSSFYVEYDGVKVSRENINHRLSYDNLHYWKLVINEVHIQTFFFSASKL